MATNWRNDMRFVSITPPAAIANNTSPTTAEIDTLGWDHLMIIVQLGATDIAMTALTVTESDTSGSGHTAITGLVWGTSTNIDGSTSALPSATDDNLFQIAQIDLRGRRRYIDLTATIGNGATGAFFFAMGILERAKVSPSSMSGMNANEVLRV